MAAARAAVETGKHTSRRASSHAVPLAAVSVGVVAFVLRLAAFNGFENDHFMHVAWAEQVRHGAWPGRDFVEPGMPLVVLLSAAVQALWPGYLSEAMLGAAALAVAAAAACQVTASITRSPVAGAVAGLATMAWYPRLYSYPKLLVPAVTLWLVCRYAARQSTARLAALAGWSVVGFLLRHDLGVMAALATVAGLAALDAPMRVRVGAAGRFVVLGLLLVSPYLAYLQSVEGLGEHVRVASEFSKSEQHQFLWTPSLTPSAGEPSLMLGTQAYSAEGLVFWAFVGLAAAILVWVVSGAAHNQQAALAAWLVFAVAYRLVILRHPLQARLPDAAVVMSIGAVVGAHAWLTVLGTWRYRRRLAALAGAAASLAAAWLVAAGVWRVVNLGDRIAQSGIDRGPVAVFRSAAGLVRQAASRSWQPYWPDDPEPPIVDYARRCLGTGDRLLVTWFAPQYFVFSGRGFAAGHAFFLPSAFTTDRDQELMLTRLGRESVPFALVNLDEEAAFSRAFPRVAAALATSYARRIPLRHESGPAVALAVRNDLRLRADFSAAPPWPCGP